VAALKKENANTSAGDFDEGKRRYILRVLGEYRAPEDVEEVVIKRVDGSAITVGDVARVALGYGEEDIVVKERSHSTIVFKVVQSADTNVLKIMEGLKRTIKDLNENYLAARDMEIKQVYDATKYIYSSIKRVRQNIYVGGSLAVLVLLLFLRNFSSILVITTAIPISIIGTFLLLTLFGRNINVVTLAGLSFAIGMVVDSSIVVLENIIRRHQAGESKLEAALRGTREVMGAIVASTLTTIAVFVPIVFVEEEAGQLFRDIAIAISSAVFLSLMVSMTVIPTMSAKIIKVGSAPRGIGRILPWLGGKIAAGITALVSFLLRRVWSRVLTVVTLTGLAVFTAFVLVPDAEYLPAGNRDFIYAFLLPPPGYNKDQLEQIVGGVAEDLRPYWEAETGSAEAQKLKGLLIDDFFYVARPENIFIGTHARVEARARELIPILREKVSKIPGFYAVVLQASLFEQGLGEGRSIDVEITGPDLEKLIQLGKEIFGKVNALIPGSQIRPIPGLDLGNPEIQVMPDREKASKVGLSASDIGITLDTLLDGAIVDDYLYEGEEIDLVLKGEDEFLTRTQDFDHILIETPEAGLVPLNSISRLKLVSGPNQINHIEQQRAIVIRIVPPTEVSMEKAMRIITKDVIGPIVERGELGKTFYIGMAGTADDLSKTSAALKWNFLLALLITFLLMSALFENFFYPLVIMFSVPLAGAGGFLGLWLVNRLLAPQALDILTMLGFVILVGIVVNNAILIVHQSLNFIREEKMEPQRAIIESVRIRVRPIFMSTTTSIFGMAPLVFFPGAGSELYRGLGSVVIGGLAVSTIFTLVLIPSLFSLVYSMGGALRRLRPHG
jgi:HAE1 family hydrophobic/amphiphilic exporter-1